jgi:DNA-binding MarR family transcriptional regulator
MTKKEKFISMVDQLIENIEPEDLDKDAMEYFSMLKKVKENAKPQFTENGKKILLFMQENKDNYNNIFKAKDIGEGLFTSSRVVSGALRKLVTDNYVEKIGENPTVYSLTEKGVEATFCEENV